MAVNHYSDINLTGHELQNFLVERVSDLPSATGANLGRIVYDGGSFKGLAVTNKGFKEFVMEDDITKDSLKTILGLADWAMAAAKPSYTTKEVTEDTNLYYTDARVKTYADTLYLGKTSTAAAATKLAAAHSLWGNSFDGTQDVSGDITLGTGKKIYFGGTDYYIELKDGNLHTNVGFWSESFISARGKDDSAGGSGGASLDLVWQSLTANTGDYKDDKINVAHIPDLSTDKITGLNTTLQTLQSGLAAAATTEFVNSSIATATATFRGTVESTTALKALTGDMNDYAFYKHTDADGNTVFDRYKYSDTESATTGHWTYEYTLNNSSFTAAQWNAINSGATSQKFTDINTALGNVLNSVAAGNGISVTAKSSKSQTISVKKDDASESFLSVSKSGIKVSGIQSAIDTAVGNADKTSLKCKTVNGASGNSAAVDTGTDTTIQAIVTFYDNAECFCEIIKDSTVANKATVNWSGVTPTAAKPMVIKAFYTTNITA